MFAGSRRFQNTRRWRVLPICHVGTTTPNIKVAGCLYTVDAAEAPTTSGPKKRASPTAEVIVIIFISSAYLTAIAWLYFASVSFFFFSALTVLLGSFWPPKTRPDVTYNVFGWSVSYDRQFSSWLSHFYQGLLLIFLCVSISVSYFNLFPALNSIRLTWKQHVLMVP